MARRQILFGNSSYIPHNYLQYHVSRVSTGGYFPTSNCHIYIYINVGNPIINLPSREGLFYSLYHPMVGIPPNGDDSGMIHCFTNVTPWCVIFFITHRPPKKYKALRALSGLAPHRRLPPQRRGGRRRDIHGCILVLYGYRML